MGCGSIGVGVNSDEQTDYNTFNNEAVVETKIALGEQFDKKYPKSRYQEQVDTGLSYLYFNEGNYPKFYAACDRVLATNPKSVPVLELVGWVIPRDYNASNPSAAAKLDEAEKYEKRALAEIAAMKKPRPVTASEFANSRASLEWRAHSGLGAIYFRRKDYADSAAELQIAIKQQGTEPDPTDLYLLGVDLEHLGHMNQAADEFAQCSVTTGSIQEQCQKAYEAAAHAAVESGEEKSYDTFNHAPNAKAQIQLGEKFDQTYPSSQYRENVESTLLSLYEGEPDWTKFYATANTILAMDPDNVPVLAFVGWVIPRHYDAAAPFGQDNLAKAEKYEKRALELIATMQKPADLTNDQFEQAKANATTRAHSGLGVTYFRLGDYVNAVPELELATANKSQADPWDFYILGTSLHKLNRDPEATEAFANCAALGSDMQSQCKRDVAAVSSVFPTLASAGGDIPPSTAREAPPAIRAETVIVPVRVVVRDNKGHAVSDLKRDNFQLYQDGEIQRIANFTALANQNVASAASSNSPAIVKTAPSAGVGSAEPSGGAESASRFIALFFDDVHLYFADMAQVRTAAEKYLSSLGPQDRIAVLTASGQNEADFTTDRDELSATIAKLQPHPFAGAPGPTASSFACPPPMTYTEASIIVDGGAASDRVLAIAAGDIASCVKAPGDYTGEARAKAEQAHLSGEQAADATFSRLLALVRQLSVLRGERDVVLVSPGFLYGGHEQSLAEVTNLAIRSNVVVNTLDAKGVYGTGARDKRGMPTDKWDPDRFEIFGYGHNLENDLLQDLADSTGGLFLHFSNDFKGSMREMSEPAEAYYLLAYAPQNLQPDGKFHVLKVSLTNGAHGNLQARRGFFAPSRLETPEEAAQREIEDALFSDEIQHDLPLKLETALTRDSSGAQEVRVKAHVDAMQLHFVKAGAASDENLTLEAALFDPDGNYVTGTQKTAQMAFDDSTLTQIEKTGVYLEIELTAKPGNYVLRTVARDSNDGHISTENATITIPN